mmetsp:Transcript_5576/g.15136  ORF Transcript_5576/g.15136 Transcript_5576/m.15136 type:complete len:183 (-) Transcript_5576:161-709(-)
MNHLNPKIWFINVGRTDLFESKCTNSYVVADILNVVKALHISKPDAKFILHGILPHKDPDEGLVNRDAYLGEYWHRAQGVNKELKRFCERTRNIWYMQSTTAFIIQKEQGRPPLDETLIKKELTAKGLRVWGNRIIEKMAEIQKPAKSRGMPKIKPRGSKGIESHNTGTRVKRQKSKKGDLR